MEPRPGDDVQCFRLHLLDPLRVGAGERLHVSSVTLTGALLEAYRHLHPYADVDRVSAEPPFAVSDAMPFRMTRAGSVEYFLPLPLSAASRLHGAAAHVDYVALPLFERLAAGRALPSRVYTLDAGRIVSGLPGTGPLARRQARGRWRDGGAADGAGAPRIDEEVRFAPGAGLYVLVRADARDVARRVEAALRLAGDCGVGAGRATGRGRFFAVPDPAFRLPRIEGAEGVRGRMLLSSWLPSDADLAQGPFAEPARYRLDWVRHHTGVVVPMVAPGSVLRATTLAGRAVAVGPAGDDGTVSRRHGRALSVEACL
jgi:hypothetical protein